VFSIHLNELKPILRCVVRSMFFQVLPCVTYTDFDVTRV